MTGSIPKELEKVRIKTLKSLGRLRAADKNTAAAGRFLMDAKRSNAGRNLPAYYLVYFMLVDFLGYRNLGQIEKIAWSIPVDLDGRAYLIEHRKFGLGVFVQDLPDDEKAAAEIVKLIQHGVQTAKPYFRWRAEQAAKTSKLNVANHSAELFQRFRYFSEAASKKMSDAENRKDERIKRSFENGFEVEYPAHVLRRHARWDTLAAIEHFFAWTEHVFIHIAILRGKAMTGESVAQLAMSEWKEKYKAALDLDDNVSKRLFDALSAMRKDIRNYAAHGAFGKNNEAFSFHSSAGAVPMQLAEDRSKSKLKFGHGMNFDSIAALNLIEEFIAHLWSGTRAPAKLYIQESHLPLILPYARDGQYAEAMSSMEKMKEFLEFLNYQMDRSANMDF